MNDQQVRVVEDPEEGSLKRAQRPAGGARKNHLLQEEIEKTGSGEVSKGFVSHEWRAEPGRT